MSDNPYSEVTIHSPVPHLMAGTLVGFFMQANIPIWIKPVDETTIKVSYPMLRVNDAQMIFQSIEEFKKQIENEKTPDSNGGL